MYHILCIRIIYVVHTFCVPQEWTLNLGDTDTHYERLQWHGTHHILNQRTANVKENVFYIAAQKRQKIIFLHKNQYFFAWKQICLHFLKKYAATQVAAKEEIDASVVGLMIMIMLRVRYWLGDEENTLKADSKWPWLTPATPRLVVSLWRKIRTYLNLNIFIQVQGTQALSQCALPIEPTSSFQDKDVADN